MKNITISKRIALGVLVPIAGLMILTMVKAWDGYKDYMEYKFMYQIVSKVNGMTALIHNMQVERGTSAGFVGSGNEDVPQAVLDARAATDKEFETLKTSLAGMDFKGHEEIGLHIGSLLDDLATIPAFREQVNAKQVDVTATLGFYSKLIHKMFEIAFESAQLSTETFVAMEIISMLDLSETKELAGMERGLTNGLLGLGTISDDDMAKLQALVAPQAIMMDNFLLHIPDLHKQEYSELLQQTNVAAVDALRSKIHKNADDLSLSGVTQTEWFSTSTARIVKLRELEKLVGEHIYKDIANVTSEQLRFNLLSLAFSVLVFVIASGLGILITLSITRPMKHLQDDMKQLSEGDVEFEIKGAEQKNELGYMALALQSFQGAEIKKRELQAATEAADKAREEEKALAAAEKAAQDEEYRQAVDILGKGLKRFSVGDFEEPIEEEFPSTLADLRGYYNDTLSSLANTLSKVRATGSSLLGDADTLRDSSSDLAQRTEAQAASLEETSTALKQITENVKDSSKRAEEASHNISAATQNSKNSDEVVGKTINAMSRIEKTSGEIAQIISVIDDIAFQTNLLALNAGVEAARAGEAGKGFAVVAQEVRDLAQRSASAAKEIEQLINNSSTEVEAGVKLVKEAGDVIAAITSDVKDIDVHMQSIAEATSEQSASLDQISTAIRDMDSTTQENAGMVYQTNEVTKRVAGGSHLLHELMANFKTRTSVKPRDAKNRGLLVAKDIQKLKEEPLPEPIVANG